MSLYLLDFGERLGRFPRVSGDEPESYSLFRFPPLFSPRERG